jgi:hypothetical protein
MPQGRLVLICDDDPQIADSWAKRLNEVFKSVCPEYHAEFMRQQEFKDCLNKLHLRKEQARNGSRPEDGSMRFDEASVLIIDYELLNLDDGLGLVTGEDIAYNARLYSTCGLIVILNEPPHGRNRFDLTFRGYSETFADLHISDQLLNSPGLWSDAHLKGYQFRPWSWPNVPVALEKFERRVEELQGHLDEPILEYFPEIANAQDFLPAVAWSFIVESGMGSASFNEFLDRSPNAKRSPKDAYPGDIARCRVAATRIHHWLERLVLPLQEILIDAPHLAMRYPSLMKKGSRGRHDAELYDLTAEIDIGRRRMPEQSWANEKSAKLLRGYRFSRPDWLTRPAWLGIKIKIDTIDLPEIRDPLGAATAPYVFCEDVSRFMEPNLVQSVAADLPTPNRIRYVVQKDRLKAAKFRALRRALDSIEYEPRIKLAY